MTHVPGKIIFRKVKTMSKNYKESMTEEMTMKSPDTGIVIADKLNLRQGPSSDSRVLYILEKGEVLEIVEDRIDWLKVHYKRLAIDGYVMSKFVKVE